MDHRCWDAGRGGAGVAGHGCAAPRRLLGYLRRSLRILSPSPVMTTSADCKAHAAECWQMAKHARNIRVEAFLIDMARMWERMSMEVEQSHATAGISTPHIRLIASQEAANGANSNSRKDRQV